MKTIVIVSEKHGSHTVFVDDDDFETVSNYHWSIKKNRNKFYAQTKLRVNGKQSMLLLHRLLMNTPKYFDTDHINGNGLDNQRKNLRICTHRQNLMNQPTPIHNTTGYKGVTFHKRRNKFMAQIRSNDTTKYLGRFDTIIEAAIAYDKAAKELHGQFANLNFQ